MSRQQENISNSNNKEQTGRTRITRTRTRSRELNVYGFNLKRAFEHTGYLDDTEIEELTNIEDGSTYWIATVKHPMTGIELQNVLSEGGGYILKGISAFGMNELLLAIKKAKD